jgi:hypothetical protein
MPLSVGCMQMPNMPIHCVYRYYIQAERKDQRSNLAAKRYEQNKATL